MEDSIFFNHVYFPTYYNIHNIPKPIKKIIDDKLMSSNYNQHFKEIVRYMWLEEDDPVEWQKFLTWTKRHDEYRKQSFSITFPEFSELIRNDSTIPA